MSIVRVAALLRSPRRAFSKDDGFSLIEVMAALFIFTLLTLGLVPLLTSSIRGSNTARADTVGKNAGLKAMERVRGLPYYVSYATSTTKVDLLDLYYPNTTGQVVQPGPVALYRTICAWNNLANPACPRDIPTGYTITFEAQFVDPVATGPQPTPGETATRYQNVNPAIASPGYRWDSPTADKPPRQILQMSVITTWTLGNQQERYTLTSLLSDRSFGGRKIKATASLGYGVDVYMAFDSRPGGATRLSSGNVFVLTSESDIEGRRLSTARQTTTALRGELQQQAGGSLASAVGARVALQAPPNQTPGNVTAVAGTLLHPEFSSGPLVAEYGASTVVNPRALAASAVPSAFGDTAITTAVSGQNHVTIRDPQLGPQDLNVLKLATRAPLLSVARFDGLPGPPAGITDPIYSSSDVAVGGTRTVTGTDRVTGQATVGIDRIYFLQANWSELENTEAVAGGGSLTGLRHLIVIDDFRASVTCNSTSTGTGTGQARFQGTLYYWEDPQLNGNRDDARYSRITFDVTSGTSGADPLAAVKNVNPLVYDHPSANQRARLFGSTRPNGAIDQLGYLSNWNSLTTTASRVETSADPTGAPVAGVNSTIEGALELETADLDADRQDSSAITFTVGSLSCYAQDAR